MMNILEVEKALQLNNTLFIDVRSPSEYHEATIPHAINIPILDDEERAIVGTTYRHKNPDEATTAGLKFASSKIPSIYVTIKEHLKEFENIVIFCWRGGMRSKSVCNLLSMLNLPNIYQLIGGYKSYRKYVTDYIENETNKFKFIMIHGLTGSGKTHILDLLDFSGQPVLNLEQMAQNSGSVFGDIVFNGNPPSQKMFESYIFHKLFYFKKGYVFVESESKRIGNVHIPDTVHKKMFQGFHILIETSLENRVKVIMQDYIDQPQIKDDRIVNAINHLRKRLGNEIVDVLLHKISEKQYEYVIEYLITNYYDPLYKYSIEKYQDYDLVVSYKGINEVIPVLIKFVNTH